MVPRRVFRVLVPQPWRVARRLHAALLASGATLLALACADADARAETQRSYCIGLCRRLGSCSPDFRVDTCVSLCGDSPTAGVTNEAIYGPLAACVQAQSCAALQEDATYEECYATAVTMIVPSQACVDFCLDDTAASFECGGGYSVEACLDGSVCTWRDDVLQAAAACNEAPDCEARATCKAWVFGAR